MRVPLPQTKPNGHVPKPGQVYAITGICQEPSFRLRSLGGPDDLCLVYLGAPQFGAPGHGGAETEPYLILRRWIEPAEAVVALRVEWEGVFTLLANDDSAAEETFRQLLQPAQAEDVQRQWSDDVETLALFEEWLQLQ